MRIFMKMRFFSIALFAMLAAGPALALDLQQARSSGAVGERLDGYVEALQHSPDATGLASDVNAKRKQEYARIGKEKGQPAELVARLAAIQIVKGLPTGASYQAEDGSWKK